jgi:hypothetical protein
MSNETWTDADQALLGDVYKLQCTSRMNVIYYEMRLGRLQFYSFWMEVVIAATASGSGLAAFAKGATGWVEQLWQALALVAAVVAVIRPIYAPGKTIEAFTRQLHGYRANSFGLEKLAAAIRQEASVTKYHRQRYDTFFDHYAQLSADDEVSPKEKLRVRAFDRVKQELPDDLFWRPTCRVEIFAGPQAETRIDTRTGDVVALAR